MNKKDAELIRKWRVENGCTWRRISELAHFEWPSKGYKCDNQVTGMDLCAEAAECLGEDASKKPWN